MAPTDITDRGSKSKDKSRGLTITSAVVKKGHPTVVKYTWTYDPKKSPTDFAVAVINVATKERTILEEYVYTRDHGKGHTGTWTVDITYLKDYPGTYILVFMLIFDEYVENIAKSKPFHLRKRDF